MDLEILYQDESILAVNKPPGLLVHKTSINTLETQYALQMVRDLVGKYVYLVHRLDKPASGVLLFAFSSEVTAMMHEQFNTDRVTKKYWAVVRGYTDEEGVIDHSLKPIKDRYTLSKQTNMEPKETLTHYKRLATVELDQYVDKYPATRYSLVELYPRTGRQHQLRRHMKHIAHPIIGDRRHGKNVHNDFVASTYDSPILLLNCRQIDFAHPLTGKPLAIQSRLPDAFVRIMQAFGWEDLVTIS